VASGLTRPEYGHAARQRKSFIGVISFTTSAARLEKAAVHQDAVFVSEPVCAKAGNAT
jgi:hypothetical protein